MASLKRTVLRAGLETLYATGLHHAARPLVGGLGAILTFHRVMPTSKEPFQPNRGLRISPEFLDAAIARIKSDGLDIVSIGEAHRRLNNMDGARRRFVVLTFDDGYRDNLEYAWPILKKHHAPFTIYVASAFADGTAMLWWEVLETAIAANVKLEVDLDGVRRTFGCADAAAKQMTYRSIYGWLRSRAREADLRLVVEQLAANYGIDTAEQCRKLCMGWQELAELTASPLVTIGSHTVSHPFLAKIEAGAARAEMTESRRVIRENLGVSVEHLAYPNGARDVAGLREFQMAAEVGYKTAVTTRRGVLFPGHRGQPTALPRISINNDFQDARFVQVLLSGAPTALFNRFRRVDAA